MPLISVTEAAEKLGVTRGRIRQLISDGRLKATKVGHYWAIDTQDLAALQRRKPGRPRKDQSENQ